VLCGDYFALKLTSRSATKDRA